MSQQSVLAVIAVAILIQLASVWATSPSTSVDYECDSSAMRIGDRSVCPSGRTYNTTVDRCCIAVPSNQEHGYYCAMALSIPGGGKNCPTGMPYNATIGQCCSHGKPVPASTEQKGECVLPLKVGSRMTCPAKMTYNASTRQCCDSPSTNNLPRNARKQPRKGKQTHARVFSKRN